MKKAVILIFFCTFISNIYSQNESVIRFGLVPDYPPTTFVDENGTPTGFFIELFSRIMDDLGYEYEYEIGLFTELYEGILNNEIDFFCSLLRIPSREDQIYWPSEAATTGWGQFFIKPGNSFNDILTLQNQKIGLVTEEAEGQNFIEYLKSLNIQTEVVYFDSFEKLIQAVWDESVIGGVAHNTRLLEEDRIQPTTIVFSPLSSYATTGARNKDMIPRVDAISTRLHELKNDPDSYYWQLYEKWMSTERVEKKVVPQWVTVFFIFLFSIILLLYSFSRILRLKIELSTRALRDLNDSLEEKVAERTLELKDTSEKLIQSEKLALTSRLVAGIAHEINTPIGVALTSMSYSEELLANLEEAYRSDELSTDDFDNYIKNSRESLTISLKNIRRAVDLIRNFKNISSDQVRYDLITVNLKEYFNSILLTVSPELKKTRLRVHTNFTDKEITSYAAVFTQIIVNFVMNSLSHAFRKGETGNLYISVLASGGICRIIYTDDGAGISPDIKEHIFEPFFTTNRSQGNTGLGLSVVNNLITEKLKGTIQVRSKPDRYTCFIIEFPC